MDKSSPIIHIGTSGWSYSHWKENFYPNKLQTNRWLNFYSQTFSTVEVNTTFYHTPLVTTTKNWFKNVPKNFLFSIKASRYITHIKRLNDCKESVKIFYKSIKPLQEKTGPILFQLPPSFKLDLKRLEEFISLLKGSYNYTFEFRHESWFNDEVYNLLSKHKIALCFTDLHGKQSPEEVTANFTYLRLHGPHKAYKGSYGLRRLKALKKKIDRWVSLKKEVFCFFDNDEKGYAIEDARVLKELFF